MIYICKNLITNTGTKNVLYNTIKAYSTATRSINGRFVILNQSKNVFNSYNNNQKGVSLITLLRRFGNSTIKCSKSGAKVPKVTKPKIDELKRLISLARPHKIKIAVGLVLLLGISSMSLPFATTIGNLVILFCLLSILFGSSM